MTKPEIFFYHCVVTNSKNALCGLLKKTLTNHKKALITIPDNAQAQSTSDFLWKYQDDVFITHGLIHEPYHTIQPILISNSMTNENKADYLFFINHFQYPDDDFERIVLLFDNHDEAILSETRTLWTELKNKDYTIKYYKETTQGWSSLK